VEKVRILVLCGASLGVSAIGASLADKPGWKVIPTNSESLAAAQCLRQLRPDVVVFDLSAAPPDGAISLVKLFPDYLLIGVDLPNHRALVLSGEQPSLFTTDDFGRLIDAQSSRCMTAGP
jgi:hypothetical protein